MPEIEPVSRRVLYLREMGLGPLWTLRARGAEAAADAAIDAVQTGQAGRRPAAPVAAAAPDPRGDVASMDWRGLRAAVASCTACGLCRTRGGGVAGDGDERGVWLVVAGAASADDEAAGLPLAGGRGVLLDNMLRAAGLSRKQGAYVTAAVKCRPVGADGRDRAPTAAERAACRPFLERETALLRPAVILVLGDAHPYAERALAAGRAEALGAGTLVALPDPQALIAAPARKAQAWEALCLARRPHGDAA